MYFDVVRTFFDIEAIEMLTKLAIAALLKLTPPIVFASVSFDIL